MTRTEKSESSEFEVVCKKGMTVLSVLEEIFRQHDPTLSFRFSCRTGLCATCGMMINHKPALSCLKAAEPGKDGYLHLSPMPKGETIKDFVQKVK